MKSRLYIAEKQYGYLQDFETLAKIISMALGGKSEEKVVEAPQTKEELAATLHSVFGRK